MLRKEEGIVRLSLLDALVLCGENSSDESCRGPHSAHFAWSQRYDHRIQNHREIKEACNVQRTCGGRKLKLEA